MTSPQISPEVEARQCFSGDTADHEMSILHDDGLYRHLRFQKPGTSAYYFDLVTWPGYLAIVGDAGDYTFARVRDMFEFFEGDDDRINPRYWAEKLCVPGHDTARRYSEQLYRQRVSEWLNQIVEYNGLNASAEDSLRRAATEQLLNDDIVHYEDGVRAALRDFDPPGAGVGNWDTWEWDLREFDPRFLWCCWAIIWGIAQYRKAQAPQPEKALT
jgi:hypothetical protein